MAKNKKARAIGFNHIALEVGDIDQALEFYAKFIDFELRGKSENMAFIDLGDQFSRYRKVVASPGMMKGILVSWYRTRRQLETR